MICAIRYLVCLLCAFHFFLPQIQIQRDNQIFLLLDICRVFLMNKYSLQKRCFFSHFITRANEARVAVSFFPGLVEKSVVEKLIEILSG